MDILMLDVQRSGVKRVFLKMWPAEGAITGWIYLVGRVGGEPTAR
jgi:hypothetical protein